MRRAGVLVQTNRLSTAKTLSKWRRRAFPETIDHCAALPAPVCVAGGAQTWGNPPNERGGGRDPPHSRCESGTVFISVEGEGKEGKRARPLIREAPPAPPPH